MEVWSSATVDIVSGELLVRVIVQRDRSPTCQCTLCLGKSLFEMRCLHMSLAQIAFAPPPSLSNRHCEVLF